MQTNPESAAVEAVVIRDALSAIDDACVLLRKAGHENSICARLAAAFDNLSEQASALDALRGEIECLRVELAGSQERAMMVLRAKDDWMERASAAERRVAELREALEGLVSAGKKYRNTVVQTRGLSGNDAHDYAINHAESVLKALSKVTP